MREWNSSSDEPAEEKWKKVDLSENAHKVALLSPRRMKSGVRNLRSVKHLKAAL